MNYSITEVAEPVLPPPQVTATLLTFCGFTVILQSINAAIWATASVPKVLFSFHGAEVFAAFTGVFALISLLLFGKILGFVALRMGSGDAMVRYRAPVLSLLLAGSIWLIGEANDFALFNAFGGYLDGERKGSILLSLIYSCLPPVSWGLVLVFGAGSWRSRRPGAAPDSVAALATPRPGQMTAAQVAATLWMTAGWSLLAGSAGTIQGFVESSLQGTLSSDFSNAWLVPSQLVGLVLVPAMGVAMLFLAQSGSRLLLGRNGGDPAALVALALAGAGLVLLLAGMVEVEGMLANFVPFWPGYLASRLGLFQILWNGLDPLSILTTSVDLILGLGLCLVLPFLSRRSRTAWKSH